MHCYTRHRESTYVTATQSEEFSFTKVQDVVRNRRAAFPLIRLALGVQLILWLQNRISYHLDYLHDGHQK
jgi:hypothetical protein